MPLIVKIQFIGNQFDHAFPWHVCTDLQSARKVYIISVYPTYQRNRNYLYLRIDSIIVKLKRLTWKSPGAKLQQKLQISIEQFLFLNFRRNDKNSKHREDVTDVKTHVIDAYASYYVCVDIIGACNFSNTVFYILFISFFLVKFEMNKS